jgi:hypothetical protein
MGIFTLDFRVQVTTLEPLVIVKGVTRRPHPVHPHNRRSFLESTQ